MQHLKKSNLFVDSNTDHHHHHHLTSNHHQLPPPLCPKPRRLNSSVPYFLNHHKSNQEQSHGILHLISEERVEVTCNGTCSTGFAGSPPRRTDNPLIHDIKFVHQMELLSPFSRTKFSAPAHT